MPPQTSSRISRRSRSPRDHTDNRIRRLSWSPRPHRHHHHHSSSHKHQSSAAQAPLPLQASPLRKHDFPTYKPMFGLYLDIQKQLLLEDLAEDEVKGRWKSFVGKWNRGELAEGWYDRATLLKAQASAASLDDKYSVTTVPKPPRASHEHDDAIEQANIDPSSDDDDVVGPTLSGKELQCSATGGRRSGPAIPNTQELELKRELEQESLQNSRDDLSYSRKADRKVQKTQLDELLPRAEAGSKERMLEKKREKADSNRSFAAAKTEGGGGVEEIPESDLFGGEDGGVEGFKKQKREMERKKNERELRKEEILRARKEEREERVREYAAREERTMSGLVKLARARFG